MLSYKKLQPYIIPLIFLIFILAPWFELKFPFFLLFVLLITRKGFVLTRVQTAIGLSSIFSFAFINTPYWQVFPNPNVKIIALVLLIIVGVLWSYASSSGLQIQKHTVPGIPIIILSALILILNYRPLITDIAWRGDESFHIYMLLHMIAYFRNINGLYFLIYLLFLIGTSAYLVLTHLKYIRKTNRETFLLIPGIGICILYPALFLFSRDLPLGWSTSSLTLWNMVRWPFFEKWLNLVFLFPKFGTDIRLYRIVPLLCTILLAWYLYYKFNNHLKNKIVSGLCAVGLVFVPIMYFFTTILYLEMPIVLLFTYCVFNIRDLVITEPKRFMQTPVWYALLILSFLKETVMILLILLLVSRFLTRIVTSKISLKHIGSELLVGILASFPLILYLLLRQYYIDVRPYSPSLTILFDLRNYGTILEALWNQTGPLAIFAAAGLIILFMKREKTIGTIMLLLLLGIIMFFMADGTNYLGYSRYNLFIIPVLYYLTYTLFINLNKPILIFFLVTVFISNYYLNPIKPDGTRLSNWGCLNTDGAEYYYPYEQALAYLKSDNTIKTVMILGHYFPNWGIQFYQLKYNYYPDITYHQFNGDQPDGVLGFDGRWFDAAHERYYLTDFFSTCSKSGNQASAVDAIIYHSVNNIDLTQDKLYCGKFRITARIHNAINSLYIFQR